MLAWLLCLAVYTIAEPVVLAANNPTGIKEQSQTAIVEAIFPATHVNASGTCRKELMVLQQCSTPFALSGQPADANGCSMTADARICDSLPPQLDLEMRVMLVAAGQLRTSMGLCTPLAVVVFILVGVLVASAACLAINPDQEDQLQRWGCHPNQMHIQSEDMVGLTPQSTLVYAVGMFAGLFLAGLLLAVRGTTRILAGMNGLLSEPSVRALEESDLVSFSVRPRAASLRGLLALFIIGLVLFIATVLIAMGDRIAGWIAYRRDSRSWMAEWKMTVESQDAVWTGERGTVAHVSLPQECLPMLQEGRGWLHALSGSFTWRQVCEPRGARRLVLRAVTLSRELEPDWGVPLDGGRDAPTYDDDRSLKYTAKDIGRLGRLPRRTVGLAVMVEPTVWPAEPVRILDLELKLVVTSAERSAQKAKLERSDSDPIKPVHALQAGISV